MVITATVASRADGGRSTGTHISIS